jgi:hypothetical protein
MRDGRGVGNGGRGGPDEREEREKKRNGRKKKGSKPNILLIHNIRAGLGMIW